MAAAGAMTGQATAVLNAPDATSGFIDGIMANFDGTDPLVAPVFSSPLTEAFGVQGVKLWGSATTGAAQDGSDPRVRFRAMGAASGILTGDTVFRLSLTFQTSEEVSYYYSAFVQTSAGRYEILVYGLTGLDPVTDDGTLYKLNAGTTVPAGAELLSLGHRSRRRALPIYRPRVSHVDHSAEFHRSVRNLGGYRQRRRTRRESKPRTGARHLDACAGRVRRRGVPPGESPHCCSEVAVRAAATMLVAPLALEGLMHVRMRQNQEALRRNAGDGNRPGLRGRTARPTPGRCPTARSSPQLLEDAIPPDRARRDCRRPQGGSPG